VSDHGNAAGFFFADNHSEIHKWRCPRTLKPNRRGGIGSWPIPIPAPERGNSRWVVDRETMRKPQPTAGLTGWGAGDFAATAAGEQRYRWQANGDVHRYRTRPLADQSLQNVQPRSKTGLPWSFSPVFNARHSIGKGFLKS
jgi:hypothetical protein